jgi:hypothetical protein
MAPTASPLPGGVAQDSDYCSDFSEGEESIAIQLLEELRKGQNLAGELGLVAQPLPLSTPDAPSHAASPANVDYTGTTDRRKLHARGVHAYHGAGIVGTQAMSFGAISRQMAPSEVMDHLPHEEAKETAILRSGFDGSATDVPQQRRKSAAPNRRSQQCHHTSEAYLTDE